METTTVHVEYLQVGKVVAEDIFANTQYPIIHKNTKINFEHLEVLKAFRISVVPIFVSLKKVESFVTNDVAELNSAPIPLPETNNFERMYREAVQTMKREFKNWESGAKIEIAKVRDLMMPIINTVLNDRTYIFELSNDVKPEEYLYYHSIGTGLVTGLIAQKLGLNRGLCIQLSLAGVLADCGMAKVSNKIRDKKESLTIEEFNEIKKHPIYSYKLVKDLPAFKNEMKDAILKHHERLDGSGYPLQQKITSALHYSQIIAVADVFHAMTTERLYRSKQSPFKVIEMIKEEEFGKYDIQIVEALMNIIVNLPIGTEVELSNLERGEVIFNNQYAPTRPMVRLTSTGEVIDLSIMRSFYITRLVSK